MAAELRPVETIEESGPAAALRVADFYGEDCRFGRFVAALASEIRVAHMLDKQFSQLLGRATQDKVAGRVGGVVLGAQLPALRVDDPFRASNDNMLLQFVDFHDALDQQLDVERMLGNKQNVGLAVRGPQTDVARMPAHDFDDADAAMALGRGADALHAARSDKNRG